MDEKDHKYRLSMREKKEPVNTKLVCSKCGNDTFHVYITIIIDDARLYCTKCGEFYP